MPRKRNTENKGLPERWRKIHGAYYYRAPPGLEDAWDGKKQFRLGATLPEAYRLWAERVEIKHDAKKIKQLLARYAAEVIPDKARSSQKKNAIEIKKLQEVFGEMELEALEPQDVYMYADRHTSKSAARREMMLLQHAYTKAVEWGYLKTHPFKGQIRLKGTKPRTRYIEDWEIIECLSLPAERKKGSVLAIQAYIRLKLLTGLRMSDLLRIKVSDCKDDGVHVLTNKTNKAVIYRWTDELRRTVELVKSTRPVDISPYLFCNKRGQGYVNADGEPSGWKSMWRRFMDRVLAETELKERLTEHDLRAKVATDASSLEHAQQLLSHADSKTTNRIYIRKAEIITPAR